MGNNFIVYKHTTPNNKVYIGITCQEPKKRWLYGKGYIHCKYFYKAIQKYGWKNIKHEILFENLTREEAIQKEIELIEKYNSNNQKYGYNLTKGGDGNFGVVFTEERKKNISKSKMGHSVSEETIDKIIVTRKSKAVLCIETNTEYYSIREAYRQTGISYNNISEVCKGIRKTAGGYHWQLLGGVE